MEKDNVNTSQCNSENDVFNAKLNNLIEQIKLIRNANKLISEDNESIRKLSDELEQRKTEVGNLKNKINERQKFFLFRGGIWVFIASYAIYAICALVLLIAAVCCYKPLLLIGGILVLLILAVIIIVVGVQVKHVFTYEKECS